MITNIYYKKTMWNTNFFFTITMQQKEHMLKCTNVL